MKIIIKLIISSLVALMSLSTGYTASKDNDSHKTHCSSEWYSLVEKQILTGDGQGHGPDLGSAEWRSVIEFKLGIRDDPKVPPSNTDHWCDFIDRNYIHH